MAAANEISVNAATEAALSQLKPPSNYLVYTKKKDVGGFSLFSRLCFTRVVPTRVQLHDKVCGFPQYCGAKLLTCVKYSEM